MKPPASFLWHDFETFGADPARDRPAQFAARRTDAELQPVGEPLVLYCRPSPDVLPHPEAVLITGITPQLAEREGVPEPEFARQIHAAFSQPGTCGAGYNSIRFDDEFTRHLLYRNFFDPYQREWYGGNSRWDLIDVMRLWHALRPQGLEWPQREDGSTSFKLEHLSAANGVTHTHAHDALSDVDATLGLARRLRAAQPRLFEHALKLRDKRFAATLLDTVHMTPVLHVSSKIPSARGCLAVIVPLAVHPGNANCIICYDIQQDPTELLELPEDELQERIFVADADLPEGVSRIPLKGVHLNKSPMLAPLSTLDAAQAARWQVDLARCQAHRDQLFAVREALADKVRAVFATPEFEEQDAELSLYAGFLPDADRCRLAAVREASPEALAGLETRFEDARYAELLFRYRARHWPETLDADEQARWREFVARKLEFETGLASLTLAQYQALLAGLQQSERDPQRLTLLAALAEWPQASGLHHLLGQD
jgi:exodeoxyribonuclease I